MDELKKIIEENRSMFNSAEPFNGHFDRFKNKLEQKHKPKIGFNWKYSLRVASVAILVILSGLYIKDKLFDFVPQTPFTHVKQEFKETEQYYVSLVNQQVNEIEQLNNTMSKEHRIILNDELTNMDNMYKKLQSELNAMPNDPRIMQAMLQHYQMKIEVLNRIFSNLNNVQHLNNPSHESIEL